MYAQLLIDLFKYLAPFLRNVELNKPMQILYKVRSARWQPSGRSSVRSRRLPLGFSRARSVCCWSCCMTSQSSCVTTTTASVMLFHPTASSFATSSSVPSRGT